jgi:hypothetical protein
MEPERRVQGDYGICWSTFFSSSNRGFWSGSGSGSGSGLDPYSIGPVDPYPDPYSESGSGKKLAKDRGEGGVNRGLI